MKSWRSIQLGDNNCDQDNIILDLFKGMPVKYMGHDSEFASKLTLDDASNHVVAIYNSPGWLSDLITFIQTLKTANSFYLGINRYLILGNDTSLTFNNASPSGQILIDLVFKILPNFEIKKSGYFDDDKGSHFNFVQPLTWVYATNKSN